MISLAESECGRGLTEVKKGALFYRGGKRGLRERISLESRPHRKRLSVEGVPRPGQKISLRFL